MSGEISEALLKPTDHSSQLSSIHRIDPKSASWTQKLIPPGSFLGSTLELINGTIGTGVLALPYAVGQSGLAFGVGQLLVCGLLGFYTARILVSSCEVAKKYSYMELAQATYGSGFRLFVKIIFFLNSWGVCVIYTIAATNFIGASLSIFYPNGELPSYLTSEHSLVWPVIFTVFIVFPLSLFRHLSGLRYVSSLGFVFIFYMTCVVIYESAATADIGKNMDLVRHFNFQGIFVTFPTAVFSYSCHMNIPDVYHELQPPIKKKMPFVMMLVILVAIIVYTLIGSFGYISFADSLYDLNCPQNILLSFGYRGFNYLETATILLIAMYIMIALPLNVKPAKEAFKDMIEHTHLHEEKEILVHQKKKSKKNDSKLKHFLMVSFVVFSQMLCAMFVPSMASMINLVGASTFGVIALNLPCLYYLKLDKSPNYSLKKIFCHSVNILAFGIGIYSTYDFFANDQSYC